MDEKEVRRNNNNRKQKTLFDTIKKPATMLGDTRANQRDIIFIFHEKNMN